MVAFLIFGQITMTETNGYSIRFVLLSIVVFLVYLPALRSGFVFDDVHLILQNKEYLSADVWSILTADLWAVDPDDATGKSFYRPLFSLSIFVDYNLFGPDEAWWFHFHSLMWHILATWGLWSIH